MYYLINKKKTIYVEKNHANWAWLDGIPYSVKRTERSEIQVLNLVKIKLKSTEDYYSKLVQSMTPLISLLPLRGLCSRIMCFKIQLQASFSRRPVKYEI